MHCSSSIFATYSWSIVLRILHMLLEHICYMLHEALSIKMCSWSIFDLEYSPDYSCSKTMLLEQLLLEQNLGQKSHRSVHTGAIWQILKSDCNIKSSTCLKETCGSEVKINQMVWGPLRPMVSKIFGASSLFRAEFALLIIFPISWIEMRQLLLRPFALKFCGPH